MKAFLTLLILAGFAGAQAPAPAPAPAAQLIGPKSLNVGQYFRVTSKGSTGTDPKLAIVPAVESTDVVVFPDGSLGLVGEIGKPGRYFIFLANVSDGKTNVATLVIEVAGASPDDTDTLVTTLQAAYEKDGKPAEKKAYLTAVYKRMATEKENTWGELEKLLAATVKQMIPEETVLRTVRDEAARYLVKVLGKIDSVPDATKQKAAFDQLADALQKVQ